MPPEPVPWDRKEFGLNDRKHGRSGAGYDALGGGGGGSGSGTAFSSPRPREPYYTPRINDLPRASPRRPPTGHYRQVNGYYQGYPEERSGGYNCTPSRSDERLWQGEESFRPALQRYTGGRSVDRECRGSMRRSPYGDSGDSWRRNQETHAITGPRSVALPVSQIFSHLPSKDQRDKSGGGGAGDVSATGHGSDTDHSLGSIGWKPLKWTRSSGLSSLKTGRSELDEAGVESAVFSGKETPIRSPVESPLPSDDGAPRKKPRLAWGQGLAKYEKKKVEGSVDTTVQSESTLCPDSAKAAPDETIPKPMGVAGCTSPVTLCSAVSSSSPAGAEDKPCLKEANTDTNIAGDSSARALQDCMEKFSIKLDPLCPDTMDNLASLLADLLQPEDVCSGDSSFTWSAAMNKLQVLRDEITMEVEKTECEIDLIENELKASCQGSFGCQANCLESADATSKVLMDSTPLKENVSATSITVAKEPLLHTVSLRESQADIGDDSPRTCAACGKSSSLVKEISDSNAPKLIECLLGTEERPASIQGYGDNSSAAVITSGSGNLDTSCNGKAKHNYIDLIMASNRDATKNACQVFDKALSTIPPPFDIWGPDHFSSCRRNDMHVREKLAIRKRQLKFKERVLTLKFRAFHHLWKEDLRLLSIRKHRPKSQKRFELSCQTLQSGSQRHRSSIRSRFTLPAGNLTLVPTTEIVEFTSKLLSDSQIKLYRKDVKMPDQILDEWERRHTRFVSNNNLIEDPQTFERVRAMINPWMKEEKEVFMEMLATFGKDFAKISSFLTHKTTADCIEFYYKNHKSDSFKDVKKQLNLRKQLQCVPTNNYLVTSGKKWNREVNAASLNILGEASVAAAHSNGSARNRQKYASNTFSGGFQEDKVSRGIFSHERASSVEISGNENETAAADVLAGICAAVSSEAMSSCVTSSLGPAEKMNYLTIGQPLTLEVTQKIDEEMCSDDDCGEVSSVDWTDEEKSIFMRALRVYGKDFARISQFVRTRSREQCKIFFSKARKCLGLDMIHPEPGSGGTPLSETNGGRSDTDDASAPEMDSAICSTQSCSKLDLDFTQSVGNTCSEGFLPVGDAPMYSGTDRPNEQYVVGISNQEEVGGNIGRFTPDLNEGKLTKEDELFHSDRFLSRKDEALLKCNESSELREVEVTDRKAEGRNDLVSSPLKADISLSLEVEQSKLSDDKIQLEDTGRSSHIDGLRSEVDLQQFVIGESVTVKKYQAEVDKDADNCARESISVNKYQPEVDKDADNCAAEFAANENVSDKGSEVNMSHGLSMFQNYQHQIPVESLSCRQEQSQASQSKLENPITPSSKMLPDPSVCFDDLQLLASQSIFSFEDQGKKHQNSIPSDFYQQYLMGNTSVNQMKQPVHILRGYPLQALKPDLRRETVHTTERTSPLGNISNRNGISHSNHFLFTGGNNDKCDTSLLPNSHSGLLQPAVNENQPEVQLRPCSQSSCERTGEQSQRTGDVKLFGQILSHPSSMQKANISLQECDSQPISPNRSRPTNTKSSNSEKDGTGASRPGSSGHTGATELPLNSYGFWDGSRIQTGYTSLPESAIMLAKYQEALCGASIYSAKDSFPCGNGVSTDYQQVFMQTLASQGKRLDSLLELQKRNGFDAVSGLQQQARGIAGVNVVGGGVMGVGGGGVSDPVAALKMHYASRENIMPSEIESWGDVGGR